MRRQRQQTEGLFKASSTALKRLAKEERFIGTDLPGFPGVLHTWGRQLQYHPHIHYMCHAGLLEQIAPQVWTIPWNVHSQAHQNGHSAFTSLAPDVFRVAISNRRLVSLTDRTVTYRNLRSSRRRTTTLDAMECIRRFLQHVLPDGFMKVRHFGLLPASWAIPPDTLRRMISKAHPSGYKPPRSVHSQPVGACCPTCGGPMHVVMRLWTATRAFLDTG